MKKLRVAAVTSAALITATLAAYAAGNWSTLPVVGGGSFCASNVSGVVLPSGQGPYGVVPGSTQGTGSGICGQTVPAGPPATTGEELVPADTQLANGAPPQTVVIPVALIGSVNAKTNRLIGGDFAINLWQRGTTPVSAASPTSAVMSADRWFAYSASSQMTVIKETGASDTIPALGLYASMRVQRPSAQTGTGAVCVGQVLDKVASQALIANNGIFSFYALAGANLSSANNNLTVTVAYYTAADSATPGTNTGTFATGTITGYQAAVAGVTTGVAGTVASGAATIPISTTWTRYGVYAPIPAANASGTAVTGVGVTICDTPVGTAGTNDWFEIEGAQLQGMPSGVTASLPNGVTAFTGFERRPASQEALYQLAYSYVLTDGAATQRYGMGQALTTSTANLVVQYPEQMRETPALTVGTTISFGVTQAAGTAQACGTSIAAVASSGSPTSSALVCTTGATNLIAGNATQFTGAATGGLLTFSAEP